jgi:hypothetical protein
MMRMSENITPTSIINKPEEHLRNTGGGTEGIE